MKNRILDVKKTGYRMWEKRVESGMGVSELLKRMGLTTGNCSYYGWVNGKNLPNLEYMARMAKALGCRIDDLVVYK